MATRKVARGTFWLGGTVGVALGLPLLSMALYALGQATRQEDAPPLYHIVTYAFLFAGVPAWLTGGGVARLVAHRSAEQALESGRPPTWGRAALLAALAMAASGAGLAVLVAVPIGGLPESSLSFLPLCTVGLIAGAATGLAIGALAFARQRRHSPQGGKP
jgi:hypothetical protein